MSLSIFKLLFDGKQNISTKYRLINSRIFVDAVFQAGAWDTQNISTKYRLKIVAFLMMPFSGWCLGNKIVSTKYRLKISRIFDDAEFQAATWEIRIF